MSPRGKTFLYHYSKFSLIQARFPQSLSRDREHFFGSLSQEVSSETQVRRCRHLFKKARTSFRGLIPLIHFRLYVTVIPVTREAHKGEYPDMVINGHFFYPSHCTSFDLVEIQLLRTICYVLYSNSDQIHTAKVLLLMASSLRSCPLVVGSTLLS